MKPQEPGHHQKNRARDHYESSRGRWHNEVETVQAGRAHEGLQARYTNLREEKRGYHTPCRVASMLCSWRLYALHSHFLHLDSRHVLNKTLPVMLSPPPNLRVVARDLRVCIHEHRASNQITRQRGNASDSTFVDKEHTEYRCSTTAPVKL